MDPLRLVLHHMEEQLDHRVGALSDAKPSSEESTADLIQLEETLSSAQDKAKKLVTLRLKLDEEAAAAANVDPREPTSAVTDPPESAANIDPAERTRAAEGGTA